MKRHYYGIKDRIEREPNVVRWRTVLADDETTALAEAQHLNPGFTAKYAWLHTGFPAWRVELWKDE